MMGKMKQKREKLHCTPLKPATKASTAKDTPDRQMDAEATSNFPVINPLDTAANIFSKVDIDINTLNRELGAGDDSDRRSAVTSKSLRGMNLTKKDKMKLRHEVWMKKVDLIQTKKKQDKERKKRQKSAVVGDMRPLQDTLPTLDLLLKESGRSTDSQAQKNVSKRKAVKKVQVRQKEMLDDVLVFQQVLEHPAYKDNPRATITEHLTNKLRQDDGMDT